VTYDPPVPDAERRICPGCGDQFPPSSLFNLPPRYGRRLSAATPDQAAALRALLVDGDHYADLHTAAQAVQGGALCLSCYQVWRAVMDAWRAYMDGER